MKPYQERVVAEKKDLEEKIDKLHTFISSDEWKDVDLREKDRLLRQVHHMTKYASVLGERIAAFK